MFLRAFRSLILSGLVLLIAVGVGPALAARALCAPEYDAGGNLTFDGRQDPPWDAERGDQIGSLLDGGEAGARRASHATTRMASQNRLVEIQTRAGLETVGAVFPSFRQRMDYDDLGRRIRSRTWHKIGGTERIARDDVFVYEGWRLSAILSGHDGSLRQRFAWGLDLSGTVGGAGNVSGLLVFEDSVPGQSHFPRYDGNGNVIGLIAANDPASGAPAGTPGAGGATAAYEYDPFGNALGATGHAASRNPFRFSTTFQDPVTRHSYYGYRFYDPANGRWLSRDPIGEAGGLNLYGFVGNDPVNAVDVLGMSTASQPGFFARLMGAIHEKPDLGAMAAAGNADGVIVAEEHRRLNVETVSEAVGQWDRYAAPTMLAAGLYRMASRPRGLVPSTSRVADRFRSASEIDVPEQALFRDRVPCQALEPRIVWADVGVSSATDGVKAGRGLVDDAPRNGIALGVDAHKAHRGTYKAGGLLERFSGHVDAKWYRQWDNYDDFVAGRISLQDFIDSGLAKADDIHFNLDGFNLHKFANWMNKSTDVSVIRQINGDPKNIVTNYELRSIITNPALSGKAKFYDPGGVEVSLDELMRRLGGLGLR